MSKGKQQVAINHVVMSMKVARIGESKRSIFFVGSGSGAYIYVFIMTGGNTSLKTLVKEDLKVGQRVVVSGRLVGKGNFIYIAASQIIPISSVTEIDGEIETTEVATHLEIDSSVVTISAEDIEKELELLL